ncbi:hypothetical protein ACFOMD_01560 [Sphingoaurantiacus capsulatus]|uniref:Uncharacterized protein n=1 Tax=Sphingoaurantiacus capsulatus TaxID=1771310 RepID=A0ABV7X7S3_9SPHN
MNARHDPIWRRSASCFIALAFLGSCASGAGIAYSTDAPPLILAPTAAAGVTDERGRFRQIFCAIREDHGRELPFDRPCDDALVKLDGEVRAEPSSGWKTPSLANLRIVVIPGIFGECVASRVLPFQDAGAHLSEAHELGRIEWVPVDGRSSSRRNAEIIRNWLASNPTPAHQQLVLVGYSKGVSDILELIGQYPDTLPDGTRIVSVAGVIAGTPLADNWEARYQAVSWLPFPTCKPGDGEGVSSLTRRERLRWLAANKLPQRYRYYSLPAFAERRSISRILKPFHKQLSSIDERNDGQVVFHDGIFPGGSLLGYAHADHWAVTLPMDKGIPAGRLVVDRNSFPRTVLLEAILSVIVEDGAAAPRDQ